MSRYFARPTCKQPLQVRPHAHWDDDVQFLPDLTVSDHDAVDTGLIDHRGDPIMRAPNPVGFGRDEEW
jgi:hypothetical protein